MYRYGGTNAQLLLPFFLSVALLTLFACFQAGNLAFYNYFQVVKEAGLLPHAHEDVQEWRDRMTRCVGNSDLKPRFT